MADESKVLVRLRLLGARLMAREGKVAAGGLDQVDRAAKRTSRGLGTIRGGKVQAEFSKINRAAVVAKRGLGGMETAAGKAGRALKILAATGAVVAAAGLASGVKSSVNFEQAMANVQGRLLTTGANMERLSGFALDLGAKTSYSASQAAEAMGELAAQGFTTNEIFKVLPGTLSLAAATGTDLAQAAEIQTATLQGFGLAAGDAARVADVLAQTANLSAASMDDMQEAIKYIAPVAKASGQSLEDMLAAMGLMSNVGIKGSQAGTTLRTALVRLTKPTDKARDSLATFGLSAGDLVGSKGLLSMPNIMGKIVKGAQGVSINQRNAALATIFGREALSGMVALVEKGPAKFRRMSGALERSTGAAKRAATIMRGTVAGAWDNFTGSLESARIKLLRGFNPALRGGLNAAAGSVNKLVADIQRIPAAIAAGQQGSGQGFGGLAGRAAAVSRALPNAKSAGRGLVAGLSGKSASETAGFSGVGAVAVKVGGFLRMAGKAGKDFLKSLAPAKPFLDNVVFPLVKGIAIGVVGGVLVAAKALGVVAQVLGFVGKAAKPFRGVIEGIGVAIGFLAGGPILQFLGGIGKIGIAFRLAAIPIRLMGQVARPVTGVFRLLGRGLGFATRALRFGFTWWRRYIGFLTGLPGRVGRIAVNLVGSFVNGISKFGGRGFKAIKSGVNFALNALKKAPGRALKLAGSIGRSVIRGIVNIITSSPGKILDAVMGIVPGPLKGVVKKGLGVVAKVSPFASGGVVRTPGVQLVGERGPELARFPVGTRVTDAAETRRLMAAPSLHSARAPRVVLPPPREVLFAELVVNLDGQQLHRGVHKVERKKQEAL